MTTRNLGDIPANTQINPATDISGGPPGALTLTDDHGFSDAATALKMVGTGSASTTCSGSGGTDVCTINVPGPNPVIVASGDLTGQTAAVSSVAAYTTPATNGTYRVGAYAVITAVTLDVIQVQVTYTDETNTSRTQLFYPQGLTSASLAVTGAFVFPTMDLRVKASTTITVLVALTTGTGSISFDVGATIEKLR